MPGEEALDGLLDLYFVIGRLQVTEAVASNVRYLASRLYADDRYDPDALTRAAERARDMLQQAVPAPLLLDLIRAVRRDPGYLPRVDEGTEEHLAAFTRRVTEQYEHDRERLAREAGRAALDADVKALFEGIELLALKGYSDEESAMLLRRDMEGYRPGVPAAHPQELRAGPLREPPHGPGQAAARMRRLSATGASRSRCPRPRCAAESVRTRLEEFEADSTNDGPVFVAASSTFPSTATRAARLPSAPSSAASCGPSTRRRARCSRRAAAAYNRLAIAAQGRARRPQGARAREDRERPRDRRRPQRRLHLRHRPRGSRTSGGCCRSSGSS